MAGTISIRVLDRHGMPVPGVRYEALDCQDGDCFGTIQRAVDDASAAVIHIPDSEDRVTVRASVNDWNETRTFMASKVQYDFRTNFETARPGMNKLSVWSFAVGVFFLVLLLAISTFQGDPSAAQRQIWQGILSIGVAAFANGILGLLEVNLSIPRVGLTVRSVGAIALAIVVYFYAPAFAA